MLEKCQNYRFSGIFWYILDKRERNLCQKEAFIFPGKTETIASDIDFPGKMTFFLGLVLPLHLSLTEIWGSDPYKNCIFGISNSRVICQKKFKKLSLRL